MVILQTTEDSLQATLHELTEVMRYERLATAELATVYEKGGHPVQTATPPVLVFPPPLPAHGPKDALWIFRSTPLAPHVRHRKAAMIQRGKWQPVSNDNNANTISAWSGTAPRQGFVRVRAEPDESWGIADSVVSPARQGETQTQSSDGRSSVLPSSSAISDRVPSQEPQGDVLQPIPDVLPPQLQRTNEEIGDKTKQLTQKELKMPEFRPQPNASCANAAHSTTLHARIQRPIGLAPPVHSQEQHSRAHAQYRRDDPVSAKCQAAENVGDHVGAGREILMASPVDSMVSVESKSTERDNDEPAGNLFSIVFTTDQGGSNVLLKRSDLEVKRFEFQGLGDESKTGAAQHVSSESAAVAQRSLKGPVSPKDRQGPSATNIKRTAVVPNAVVPKLQSMPQGVERTNCVDHVASTASAKSQASGWSRGKKKTSTGASAASVASVEASKFTPQLAGPALLVTHLAPGDDPGKPGVGWITSDAGKARGAEQGSMNAALKTSEPKIDAPGSRKGHADTQSSQRRIPIIGFINTEVQPAPGSSAWRQTTAKSVREMRTGDTDQVDSRNPASTACTGQMDATDSQQERPSGISRERPSGISEDTLEKLRVWYDESESESDCESDAGSDTRDPVTTTKSMPARNVKFLKSPPKEKQESVKTPNSPNSAREEQLCEWENSARGEPAKNRLLNAHATNWNLPHTVSSRRGFSRGNGLSNVPGRTSSSKHTRGRNSFLATPYTGTSGQSRYMTGDTMHEYVQVRDVTDALENTWRQRLARRQSQVSIVTFLQEPVPSIPMGTMLKGGRVRSILPENLDLDQRKCHEVLARTQEPALVDDLPKPQGKLEPWEYQNMLRDQGIQPLVMSWGSGMTMDDVPDIEDMFRGENNENLENIKYYPKLRLAGSEVHSAQISHRKRVRIHPAVYEEKAITCIKEREKILSRLHHALAKIPRGESDPETVHRHEICNLILDLRAFSVFVVEALSKWQRACGPKARSFIWEGEDYFLKLFSDTEDFETYTYISETLCVQGPFFLRFAKLQKKDDTMHAMLVRTGYDSVPQEEIVNSPPLADQQRISAVEDYLRSRNERVRFKESKPKLKSDSAYKMYGTNGVGAELFVGPSAAGEIHTYEQTDHGGEKGHSQTVHNSMRAVAGSFDIITSRRSQQETNYDDTGAKDQVTYENSAAELSFEELDFSLNDEEKARLIPTEKSRAKINVEDRIKLSSMSLNFSSRDLDHRIESHDEIQVLKKSHHQTQVFPKKLSQASPLRSQQMLRGEGAFKVVTRLGGHEAVTSEQGEEELDHDTILHIFRCVDEDSDEFVNPDDLMKQFENLEVRPKRADVEQMYHQHANVSLPGGTNKIMNFEGFKRMFPDFQQLILTFQEISRERVEGFLNDNLSSFKDKMRSAKMSQWGEDWNELSSLLLMGDRIASPRPISSSSALPRSSAAAFEYLLG